jgi:hypothetical protein
MMEPGGGETIRPLVLFLSEIEPLKSGTKMQRKTSVKPAKNGIKTPVLESKAPVVTSPTREAIARRAYEIYAARGNGGRELEDWIQAERELGVFARN